MNSSMQGRYTRPFQLFQQLDFSAVPVSSYADLANLVDTTGGPQLNSVNHHLAPPVDTSGVSTNRSMTGEITSSRPAPDFFMPSTFNDPGGTQGLAGNFSHFQHFPNQMLFHENSYHSGNSKMPNLTKPWFNSAEQNDGAGSAVVTSLPENTEMTVKPHKGRKPSKEKKEKKVKAKRVRYIKPGCSDLCRRRCKQKISQSVREDLFNRYWNLEDDANKKEFIAQNAIKMPMMKCKEGSRRSFSVDWAFTINGESFSVCKLFFLHTLDIPENTAYAAIKGSSFFTSDTPIIKGKAQEKSKSKPSWCETDLDDYCCFGKKGKYSRGSRYDNFTKMDKFSQMRPGCKNCRRNCQSKFTYEDRFTIFNEYRGLSNIRKQRDYISKYIHRMERKRIRAGESTRRNCSIQWNLPLKGKEIPVCKTFFLHTVGISERSAYNIGVQNEIEPVERNIKRPRKNPPKHLSSGKGQSFSSIIAKGKLRSALKLSRKKKKKKIESDYSDTEEDMEDDYYFDSWKENTKKRRSGRKRGRKRRKVFDKTVKLKKIKLEIEDNMEEEQASEETEESTVKDGAGIRISSTLFRLPIKKRGNMKHTIPILKIKKGRVVPLSKKRRNPYKRKDVPVKCVYNLCPENCKKKCRQNLSAEARKEIFQEFWALKNMEEQRQYIAKCVKRIARPTCACLVASHLRGKRRGYKISWNLMFRGLDIPVCKMFFMHVLQISDSVVYKAVREDDTFVADETVHPCKHFTGHNAVSRPLLNSTACTVVQEDDVQQKTVSEQSLSKVEIEESGNSDLLHSERGRQLESHILSLKASIEVDEMNEDENEKDEFQPQILSRIETGVLSSTSSNNNSQSMQKTHSSVPQTSQNSLCNIEANYETLIPSLHNDHSQDSDQSLPVHFSSTQMAPYCPGEKLRSTMNSVPPPLSSCNQNEVWHKQIDSFHPMFSGSHPVFPSLSDNRMEPVHNMTHPRDLSSHFAFPQNSSHAHFPAQSSTSHHSSSLSQLHPNLQAPHMNHSGHMNFNSNIVGNFYHSSRFHNFNGSAGMSRDCVPNNSEFSMSSDHQAYQDSLLVHSLRNTSSDLYSPTQNKPRVRKKRKKTTSVPKPKPARLKEPGTKRKREKKPFVKHVKAGCLETCKRKCTLKIPIEARENIFQEFWSLENDTQRREYVLPIVHKVPKKTCSGVNSRRCCTIEWTIPYAGENHVVCKRFFLDTFDIGEKFVKTVFDKLERKGGSMEDLRGRHCKRSNVFVREQEEIEKHIRSVSTLKAFQCISCKKDFTRWCLEPGVVVSQLYKMYADQRKLEGKKPACRTSYTDMCTKKFNLKNTIPEDSVCDMCAPVTEASQVPASNLNDMSYK